MRGKKADILDGDGPYQPADPIADAKPIENDRLSRAIRLHGMLANLFFIIAIAALLVAPLFIIAASPMPLQNLLWSLSSPASLMIAAAHRIYRRVCLSRLDRNLPG
ncbi:hypothetical protein [Luteolibacter luteus]|uniref:Uncharacterized protein n=1 Tax=Luteolibacter luteus TaxID=2728835 RepID=A0A858RKC8_9BACT|nr:hypothetical protein [Luteolibacter luteus]QJE97387.1 hypothetical protein HHL09_16865 [Luteolibacter luteus]